MENELAVGRTKLPESGSVQMEVLNAREELRVCEEEMRQLEKAVEDASNPSRLRLLPGGVPTREELSEKLEKVEVCVCVHVCMCTCYCSDLWCMCPCVCVHVCVNNNVYAYTCACVHVWMCYCSDLWCMCVCVCARMC